MYAAFALNQNSRKWYQTQVFRYPRIGGFEIYVNKGKVRRQVFSKLGVMKWPNPQWVVDKIVACVESIGGWDPVVGYGSLCGAMYWRLKKSGGRGGL